MGMTVICFYNNNEENYQITCKQKKPLSGLVIYTKKMSLDHQQEQSRLIFRS